MTNAHFCSCTFPLIHPRLHSRLHLRMHTCNHSHAWKHALTHASIRLSVIFFIRSPLHLLLDTLLPAYAFSTLTLIQPFISPCSAFFFYFHPSLHSHSLPFFIEFFFHLLYNCFSNWCVCLFHSFLKSFRMSCLRSITMILQKFWCQQTIQQVEETSILCTTPFQLGLR